MTVPPTTEAVRRWRADTPGADRLVHLNNAAAALVPRTVADRIAEHLRLESELGGYEASDARAEALAHAYAAVARLLGTLPGNIAMVQNATVGFDLALTAFDFRPGDAILTTTDDYASNQIAYLSMARRLGIEVVRAPDAPEGGVDPGAVREILRRRRPRLVALTWIPTNSGLVQPAETIGEICREAEVPYLLDACQAVGQMPIDVARLGCDYLAAAARKFLRGPRGMGFLFVADRALAEGAHPLHVDMHGATWSDPDEFALAPDARRFESWERSFALILGLGAAAEYALELGLETARDRARALAEYARVRLAEVPGARVLDRGPERCAIATVEIAGQPATALKLALRARGINTGSVDRHSAVIDMDGKRATSLLRISPHYYNTADEVNRAVEALQEMAER